MNKIFSMVAIMALSTMAINAAGTAAGTDVSNTARLSFSLGGVSQTDVTSNTDTFVVDKKIDFLLTNNDGQKISVVPGDTGKITTWSITNEGNLAQKFSFTAAQLTNGETVYGNADTQDTEALTVEASTDGGSTWTALSTIEIAPDATVSIRIKTDINIARKDGDVMNIRLEAVAVQADGSTPETATSGADTAGTIDTVLAEGVGVTGDAKEDGKFVAWGGYMVAAPNLSLVKSSCVISDIVNGVSANAKRIPGAKVLYILDINNIGTSTDATNVTISDVLPATLDASTIANLKQDDGQASCSCSNGVVYSGGTAATNAGSGSTVKVEGLTISKTKHNCVSFEVDII